MEQIGTNGKDGARGSTWTAGTACTGTNTTGQVFSTGISSALVNDMYLNTSTGYVYKCTTAGNATTAKWAYVGSIKGATGATGAKGDKGDNATTTATATSSANGLMSKADKAKLDGIDTGANKYTLPTANGSTLGGVKTTSSVTSNSGYTACPIISGVPYYKDTNTTYNDATADAHGLMTAAMVTKLNGIATGATKNTIENSLTSTSTTNGLSAAQGKVLNDKITNLTPKDRNTTGTQIPVYANGKFGYTQRKFATEVTHTDYSNDQDFIPTMSFLSFWNGAYKSTNKSNLQYCKDGEIQAKPTTLYNNATGTNGTVTLSQSAANFNYIEISYRDDDQEYNVQKVYAPNGKIVPLSISTVRQNNEASIKGRSISINGTSITTYVPSSNERYGEVILIGGGSTNIQHNNKIYITQVRGYK